MAAMNAEYINPFLVSATKVMKDMVFVDAKIGKPYMRETNFEAGTSVILLGVVGQIKGQAIISISDDVAIDIASKMCMTPLTVLDDLSRSACCELGNMILGNTATVFSSKGIIIDITPPTMCSGPVSFTNFGPSSLCVPLFYDETKKVEISVSVA
jgi:chemotaxis protein CheX